MHASAKSAPLSTNTAIAAAPTTMSAAATKPCSTTLATAFVTFATPSVSHT